MRKSIKSIAMLAFVVLFVPSLVFAEYYFTENIRVHDDPNQLSQWTFDRDRTLAYANGTVFAAYLDGYGVWNADVYVAKSIDDGKSFKSPVKVNDTPPYSTHANHMSMAVDRTGQYVYVIWTAYRQGWNPDIYFARSIDGGESFEPNVRVDTNPCDPYQGRNSITVDKDGNVYVVWEERGGCGLPVGIYMAKSTDHGATFNDKVRVSPDTSAWVLGASDVMVDDAGNVYVAWMGYWYDARINVSVSSDGGSSFSTHTVVDSTSIPQDYPQITVRGNGEVWVAWHDWRSGVPNIYVAHSTDSGQTFSPAIVASDRPAGLAGMAQDNNGNIYISYSGDNNVYMTWSDDGGNSFKPSVKVNDQDYSAAGWSSTAVSEKGQVFVNWTDTRNGNLDVYFAASNIPVLNIAIDIKPGSLPNSINLSSKGVVPVAILNTPDFDATTVDAAIVIFAGAKPQKCAFEDVDTNGTVDLICHFSTQELVDLNTDSSKAKLTGKTLDGISFAGEDSVNIVPSKK